MTFREYLQAVAQYHATHDVRTGQALYNCLPDTMLQKFSNLPLEYGYTDPYYLDGHVPKFLVWAYDNWED